MTLVFPSSILHLRISQVETDLVLFDDSVCFCGPFLTCIICTIDISRPAKCSKSSVAHYITKPLLLPLATKELLAVRVSEETLQWCIQSLFLNDATKFQLNSFPKKRAYSYDHLQQFFFCNFSLCCSGFDPFLKQALFFLSLSYRSSLQILTQLSQIHADLQGSFFSFSLVSSDVFVLKIFLLPVG